ncbi:MAG: Icc protein [Gammaproteobacteria bacterium]|jgi:Icc protein
MMNTLKLAIVSDIHHGPSRYTKIGAAALPLLRDVCNRVTASGADMLVDLGDRISNANHDTDKELMSDVVAVFEPLDLPRVHLLGNHDMHYLSKVENESAFGRPLGSHSIDLKGWHLVFWQIDLSGRFPDNPLPCDIDLEWLRADLAGTTLPAVVFTHVPLDGASMIGNYYFENNPASATLRQASRARQVIGAAGNVVLCVAGHVHWNNVSSIDGIRFLTIQSLAESFTTEGEASGAWAEIELSDRVRWRVHGGDPVEYEAPIRGLNQHWARPLPPFDTLQHRKSIAAADAPVRGILLDMDGVLFRGDTPIEGAAEAIHNLRSKGIAIACLTNNARRTAGEYAAKLNSFGIEIDASAIVTSGTAVIRYLSDRDSVPKVHIVGSDALRRMLLQAGAVESDTPDYVVAGFDLGLKIADLTPAVRHIASGATLIASNGDVVIPTPQGPEPEAGSIIAFLEAATGTKALILGKPRTEIFEVALERLGVVRDEVVMIGDTPATDIAGATAVGLRSFLVESGNPIVSHGGLFEPTVRFADLRAAANYLTAQAETYRKT